MHILVAMVQTPFVRGGAEVHAEGLVTALQTRGHKVEMILVPFVSTPPAHLLDAIVASRLMDLNSLPVKADLMIGMKFPAYLLPHPNKVLWIIHQHRPAYDLWGHALCGLDKHPNGRDVREAIMLADRNLIPEARRIYTNSLNTSARLKRYCGIQAEPLYPPVVGAEHFYVAKSEDYFFFPSRVCLIKRQELVLKALPKTRNPVIVHFSGSPDEEPYGEHLDRLIRMLKITDRVKWFGHISEVDKWDRFARALGVLFPPMDEDYGYVTLEAMLSSKPVITCTDSGGPLEFVQHRKTGLVVEPDPLALAEAMDELWENRSQAEEWGVAGRDIYEDLNINWSNVVDTLLR